MLNGNDRIKEYLVPKLGDIIFDELSDGFLERYGLEDVLSGVPVPIRKSSVTEDMTISTITIARDMAFVLGCDPEFRYRDSYVAFIERCFAGGFVKPLLSEAAQCAEAGDFETACVFARAALVLKEDDPDALCLYGRVCHDAYEKAEGEDYIGTFKAESMRAFERLTVVDPGHEIGHYYLGYAYLNLGLYIKSMLTFREYLKLSDKDDGSPTRAKVRREVEGIVARLKDPCRIEEGYNCVLSGRFETGIEILSMYEDDERYNKWWPLWYYLGMAYTSTGDAEAAESAYLRAIALSPSNREVMGALADLYKALGNTEKEEKYRKKIAIATRNIELDREEKRKMSGTSVS